MRKLRTKSSFLTLDIIVEKKTTRLFWSVQLYFISMARRGRQHRTILQNDWSTLTLIILSPYFNPNHEPFSESNITKACQIIKPINFFKNSVLERTDKCCRPADQIRKRLYVVLCRYKQRIQPFNVRNVLQTNCGHRNVDFQSSVLITETICRFLLQLFVSFLRRLRSGGRSDMWQEVS